MSVTYLACSRDQHSPFPIGTLESVWCALCGASVCAQAITGVFGMPLVCRRALFHDGMHREGVTEWVYRGKAILGEQEKALP